MKNQQKYQNRLRQLEKLTVAGPDIRVFLSTAEFRDYLFGVIEKSRSRILITTLYLENDDAGKALLNHMYNKKQQHPDMDIRIFVDYHRARRGLIGGGNSDNRNIDLYREFANKFEHDIPVLGVPVKQRELFGVLHLKGIIIDDELLYSGASINNVYLHFADKYRYDRYILLRNKELCDSFSDYLSETLDRSYAVTCLNNALKGRNRQHKKDIRAFKRTLKRNRYLLPEPQSQKQGVGISPIIGMGRISNELNRCIRDLIRSSESHLYVLTPYFNLPEILKRDIRGALLRHVEVNIVVGDKTANDFYIDPSEPFRRIGVVPFLYEIYLRKFARYNERFIRNRQLNIYLWQHEKNTFHLKGVRCDDSYHLLTGNNLNARAWGLDLENGLLITDAEKHLLDAFNTEWATILEHTRHINSYLEIEDKKFYPENIRRTLNRVRRIRADALLKRLM